MRVQKSSKNKVKVPFLKSGHIQKVPTSAEGCVGMETVILEFRARVQAISYTITGTWFQGSIAYLLSGATFIISPNSCLNRYAFISPFPTLDGRVVRKKGGRERGKERWREGRNKGEEGEMEGEEGEMEGGGGEGGRKKGTGCGEEGVDRRREGRRVWNWVVHDVVHE